LSALIFAGAMLLAPPPPSAPADLLLGVAAPLPSLGGPDLFIPGEALHRHSRRTSRSATSS
jgi:hypothetical protein